MQIILEWFWDEILKKIFKKYVKIIFNLIF